MVSASKLHLGIHINYAFKGPEFKRVIVQTKFLNSMNVHEISEDIASKEAV